MNIEIKAPDISIEDEVQHKIDFKTKPTRALGRLEEIAKQICLIQQSLNPQLLNPTIVVFAADHGIANEGVSAYPQEVTWQMVYNFIQGGAAINVFAKDSGMDLLVVDAGVNYDFSDQLKIRNEKIAKGTNSFLHQPAMNLAQYHLALKKGGEIVNELNSNGCNVVGFGEMGIGNTSSAAVLMHLLTKLPLADCVGRGTGLNEAQLSKKIDILNSAISKNYSTNMNLESIIATFGGFEIVMMIGAMLQAANNRMLILIDGFICTSAFLCASNIYNEISSYAIFCHTSEEKGHKTLLEYLDAKPLLNLGMRLGEGTGCAVAYPIIRNAVSFMDRMASFEQAGVSSKD